MILTPLHRDQANAYVREHHRHSGVTQGYKFALGASVDGQLVGVAIVGRPLARGLQDGTTLEVLRLCTNGARNACSFLYGACRRAAKALGYRRLVTYTLESETGASLRAANFSPVATVTARHWDTPSRRRAKTREAAPRVRWEVAL